MLSPASRTGLPSHGRCVNVGPPLSANGLSIASRGVAAVPYADLCGQLDIDRPDQAATMNTTVKHKFEATLRRHVRQSLESDDEVDQEIAELMEILGTGHA